PAPLPRPPLFPYTPLFRSDNNARFPFSFTKSPRSIAATLSLPLFDGFAREQRLQEAMASRSDARYSVKARELALTADVTAAYLRSEEHTSELQSRVDLVCR